MHDCSANRQINRVNCPYYLFAGVLSESALFFVCFIFKYCSTLFYDVMMKDKRRFNDQKKDDSIVRPTLPT